MRAPRASGLGEALLATAWAVLASARAEQVDLHLASGIVIAGARAVRLTGRLAEAGPAADCWTHAFDVESILMVELVPRGGRR